MDMGNTTQPRESNNNSALLLIDFEESDEDIMVDGSDGSDGSTYTSGCTRAGTVRRHLEDLIEAKKLKKQIEDYTWNPLEERSGS